MISALFIAQSFQKVFVHFWMTFYKNSIRISYKIIFVNKHWPQSCLCPFKVFEFQPLITKTYSSRPSDDSWEMIYGPWKGRA